MTISELIGDGPHAAPRPGRRLCALHTRWELRRRPAGVGAPCALLVCEWPGLALNEADRFVAGVEHRRLFALGDQPDAACVLVLVVVLPGPGQIGLDDEIEEKVERVDADRGPRVGALKVDVPSSRSPVAASKNELTLNHRPGAIVWITLVHRQVHRPSSHRRAARSARASERRRGSPVVSESIHDVGVRASTPGQYPNVRFPPSSASTRPGDALHTLPSKTSRSTIVDPTANPRIQPS